MLVWVVGHHAACYPLSPRKGLFFMKHILFTSVAAGVALVGALVVAPLVGAEEYTTSMCTQPDPGLGGLVRLQPPSTGSYLKGIFRQTGTGPVFIPVPDGWMPAMIPDPSGGALAAQYATAPYQAMTSPLSFHDGLWSSLPLMVGGWSTQ